MFWLGALTLSGCNNFGTTVARVFPVLEVVNPEYAAVPLPCDEAIPTSRAGPSCIIDELTCGDVIEGSTIGGNGTFGDGIYRNAFCTVERHHYDNAPEARYRLLVPSNRQANIRLDSNCVDLDVVAIAWEETDRCPTEQHAIHECEMDVSPGGGSITVQTVDRPQRYILAVDGKDAASGNFRLTVTCNEYR